MNDKETTSARSAMRKKARSNIDCLLRPQSVAIIGVSSKPGSAGEVVLKNLLKSGYKGAIHLVGRSGGEIHGYPVCIGIDELPNGIELAILVVPAAAVRQTIDECISKGAKSAVCFASGFAETGEEGRAQQRALGAAAEAGGLALIGPNTVGYFNFVDSFHVLMVNATPAPPLPKESGPALAIVAQSGGIGVHIAASLQSRAVPISYVMTTGNEAHLGLADFIDTFSQDERTGGIVVYAEQIADPDGFLNGARRAREAGRPVVMMHPGKSEKAKEAASSHTGALAGNHTVMRLATEQAGVVVVDTMEELIDVSQLLLRYPNPQSGGLGILTFSGAICVIALDYAEQLGLSVPPLSEAQAQALQEHLPPFTPPRNPLDLGTLVGWKPELMGIGAAALLADPAISSLLVSFPMTDPGMSVNWMKSYIEATQDSAKPMIYVIHSEDQPLAPELVNLIEQSGVVVMRSPERALRALGRLNKLARRVTAPGNKDRAIARSVVPEFERGTLPEWRGKEVLRSIEIPVPAGAFAKNPDEAVKIAQEIGFPVVMKAQSAALAHKSDAGGVMLNLADEATVRSAWRDLYNNIAKVRPDLKLDGILVETMGEPGLELVVGAHRDAKWGPIVMIGLGGIWIEALGDVRLIPTGLPVPAICDEIRQLKASKLLNGFRGSPPVDIEAVAKVAAKVGDLMIDHPEIIEIDINPLIAYGSGKGALALDALIVTKA